MRPRTEDQLEGEPLTLELPVAFVCPASPVSSGQRPVQLVQMIKPGIRFRQLPENMADFVLNRRFDELCRVNSDRLGEKPIEPISVKEAIPEWGRNTSRLLLTGPFLHN